MEISWFSGVFYLNASCPKLFSHGSGAADDSAPQVGSSGVCREIEMKRLFAATTLALALISGVVTTAQADNRDRHERRYDRHDDRHDNRRDYRHDRGRDWDRHASFRHYDGRPYRYTRYVRPSGYYYRSWSY